jgi:hypothetical protein
VDNPYADFPHLEGAEATCGEVSDCWRSPVVTSWRSAARDLERRLTDQGYAIADVTGQVIDIDSGVQVYAVSKPGEPTYYLNFISVGDGVLYTMTDEPMNIEEILYFQRS